MPKLKKAMKLSSRSPKYCKTYTNQQLTSAIEACNAGMPVVLAAKAYKVPKSTLFDKIKG